MKKFKVLVTGRGTLLATFESYEEARNIAIKEAKSTGKETCVLEVKSTHNPEVIDSYEAAKTYLGEDAKTTKITDCTGAADSDCRSLEQTGWICA